MKNLERLSTLARHNHYLSRADWLWNKVRPIYNGVINIVGRNGIERVINGSDRLLILPSLRGIPESYEPVVWKQVMAEIKQGDIVADVGAHVGLYTCALAKRIGNTGKIFAFEPDPDNSTVLQSHVEMNRVEDRVEILKVAVGDFDGTVSFKADASSESHICREPDSDAQQIPCQRMDTLFRDKEVNILKVDVEGYEEHVLRGASHLLSQKKLAPRAIFIEVHPYAWDELNVSSESLLGLLHDYGYEVFDMAGNTVQHVQAYGEIVARRKQQ